jgi:HK97 family phage major capsid protein/HK97 family phage prohead protease
MSKNSSFKTRIEPLELMSSENYTSIFSFSSEQPVDRGIGNEILDHSQSAVDLSRCDFAPFLWNHDQCEVLGKIERAWLENRKGYVEVKWSRNEDAMEKWQDVQDGILMNVSCGYRINSLKEGYPQKGDYTVTNWTVYEVSLVAIPADNTVGFGRDFSVTLEKRFGGEQVGTITESSTNREDIVKEERERIASINYLANRYNDPRLGEELISTGVSVEAARAAFSKHWGESNQQPIAKPADYLGLTPKEDKQYSLLRAINACVSNDWSKAGFERECSQEIEKRTKKTSQGGFFMPVKDLTVRTTYAVGTNSTGGYTVQTDVLAQNFIELLRNKAFVVQAGATMLPGLVGNIAIPTQATGTPTYWVGESGTLTQGEATFGQVPMAPKTVGALSQISRLLLAQSAIEVEQFVRNDFAKVIAIEIDRAAINGSGASNQPTGVLATSGIGVSALGTNGAAPTWVSIVNLLREIAIDNADVSTMKILTNPSVVAKLMTTSKQSSGVEGNFILGENMKLLGYDVMMTNQVPANLTKGSGTALSAMILGNWSDLVIGEWGTLEILPNPYGSGYTAGALDIRAMQSVDIAVRHAESFAVIKDIVTT